ncbi:MAG: hypothetical protein Q9183_003526, partial [Haloplaca sp. 2 TL-2023]
ASNENCITSNADAGEPRIRALTHITMDTEGVAGTVQVYNSRFRVHVRKEAMSQLGNVLGKFWRWLLRVCFRSPVILATKGKPPELTVQKLRDGQWLVDIWIHSRKTPRRVWINIKERTILKDIRTGLGFGGQNIIRDCMV